MNIGLVYTNQGKSEDALVSYQPALALFKQLGDPLGQANALMNIGNVYAAQEKKREAIAHLTQARTLYLQYGFNPQGLQRVENSLARLRTDAE